MTEILAYLFVLLMGAIVGATVVIAYGLHQLNKTQNAKKAVLEDLKRKAQEVETKTSSIKERLIKASKLTQTQQELRSQMEMPSKNGLHSKYKNGLAAEIAEIEKEKLSILRSILAEGFNPLVTVLRDGDVKEEIPLSEYVQFSQEVVDTQGNEEPKPMTDPSNDQPRKVGKFFVYRGGKDDKTTH